MKQLVARMRRLTNNMTKLTDKQIEELQALDDQRKEAGYLYGSLYKVKYWLREGYKDADDLDWLFETIDEKCTDLLREADSIVDVIMLKRKEWGVN